MHLAAARDFFRAAEQVWMLRQAGRLAGWLAGCTVAVHVAVAVTGGSEGNGGSSSRSASINGGDGKGSHHCQRVFVRCFKCAQMCERSVTLMWGGSICDSLIVL